MSELLCRGSWTLGTACGKCSRCLATMPSELAQPSCSARAFTKVEAKDAFLTHIRALIDYWSRVDGQNEKEKLSGLAFSILNIFDGTTIALPAMDIVLRPHKSDKQFCKENGENWWVAGMVINDEATLHEEFYPPNAASGRPEDRP